MIYEAKYTRILGRCIGVVLLVGLLSIVATAYTLVMRDGRRVEIPADFIVSRTALTYEISPGFQRTILLASIDILATERVNNESLGSFLKRATNKTAPDPIPTQTSSRRSITNRDLEAIRQTRLASEAAYERRRNELGLPTLEETRRAAELEADRSRERMVTMRSEEAETESYWRSRASELRAEIASTNARIDFVRARLNETANGFALGGFATAVPFGLVGQSRFNRFGQPRFQRAPVLSPWQVGPQIAGRSRFGGRHTRAQILVNPVYGRRAGLGFPNFAPFPLLSNPFQDYDYSYERSELMVQLDELLGHRAGLQARWQSLAEEARRAGAYPGWLRP
jgi:hypothetical protein